MSRVAILSAPNTPVSTIASFESSESDHSKSMSDSIARLSRLTGYFSMLCSAYCFVHWPDDWITKSIFHEEHPWRSIDCSDRERGGHAENVGINDRRCEVASRHKNRNLVLPPIIAPGTKPGRVEDEKNAQEGLQKYVQHVLETRILPARQWTQLGQNSTVNLGLAVHKVQG